MKVRHRCCSIDPLRYLEPLMGEKDYQRRTISRKHQTTQTRALHSRMSVRLHSGMSLHDTDNDACSPEWEKESYFLTALNASSYFWKDSDRLEIFLAASPNRNRPLTYVHCFPWWSNIGLFVDQDDKMRTVFDEGALYQEMFEWSICTMDTSPTARGGYAWRSSVITASLTRDDRCSYWVHQEYISTRMSWSRQCSNELLRAPPVVSAD